MSADLTPEDCPFCNSTTQLHNAMGEWWCACNRCKASSQMYGKPNLAVISWNARTEASASLKAQLETAVDDAQPLWSGEVAALKEEVERLKGAARWMEDLGDGQWAEVEPPDWERRAKEGRRLLDLQIDHRLAAEAQRDGLLEANNWLETNFRSAVAGRPVRDMAECLAFAKQARDACTAEKT